MFFGSWRGLIHDSSRERNRRQCHPVERARPRLERLEPRDCPAVSLVQKGSSLFITGDLAANAVGLVREANEVRVTLGNGRMQTFQNVTAVFADLGGGDDQMDARIIPPAPLSPNDPPPPPFALSARLGAGNDAFESIVVEPPDPSNTENASISIMVDGRGGNDSIIVIGGKVNGEIPLVLDELSIEAIGGPGGDEVGIIIINSRIGSLTQKVRSGDGPDEVLCLIANATVGPVERIVDLGEGNDAAAIVTATVTENMSPADLVPGGEDQFRDLKARGDMNERPRFPFPLLHGGDVRNLLDGQGGRDSAWLNLDAPIQVSAVSFEVDLGAGDDILSAGIVLRPLLVAFNPQPEPPVVRLGANLFGGIGMDLVDIGVDLVPAANANVPENAGVEIDVTLGGGDGNDTLTARLGIGPTPFVPELHCAVEMLGDAGNDVLDLAVTSVPVQNGAIPGQALVELSMKGGGGMDSLTSRMGIGPTPFVPQFNINLLMHGGIGDDVLTAGFISNEAEQKVADLTLAMGGGDGDDRIIAMWEAPAFETSLAVDGGAGFDVCLHSDPARLLNVEVARSI